MRLLMPRRDVWTLIAGGAVLAAAVGALPQVADLYIVHLMVIAGIYVLLVFGLQIVLGMAGQFMVGYAGVIGIGAYTCALLTTREHFGFWQSLPPSMAAGAIASACVGLMAIRFTGHFVAIMTFAFNFVVYEVMVNWISLTGGWAGIAGVAPPEGVGDLITFDRPTWFYFVWILVFATGIGMFLFQRTPWGYTLLAVRDDPLAAEGAGIPTKRVKVLAYLVSGALAGLGGTLLASYLSVIDPGQYNAIVSVNILAMLLLGGKDSVLGAALGAVLLSVLPEELQVVQNVRWLAYGLILIVMMLVLPGGLTQLASRLADVRRFAARRPQRLAPAPGLVDGGQAAADERRPL